MPTVAMKHEFLAPSDILEKERQIRGVTAPHVAQVVNANPLVGTWVNCDHQTRGLVRVMIAINGNAINVHAFGACTPTPCDWGMVPGMVYADNVTDIPAVAFTAHYNFAFKDTIIVGRLETGLLTVETFDHFKDGSGRSDYYSRAYMSK